MGPDSRSRKEGSVRGGYRMPLLLVELALQLFLLPKVTCGAEEAKCPLNFIRDEYDPGNYYRPGDYLVGGIVSVTAVYLVPLTFNQPPKTKFAG